jgi:hypothetical protein
MGSKERLTEKHYNGKGYYLVCSGVLRCDSNCDDCEKLSKAIDRLGEFEDKAEQTVDAVPVERLGKIGKLFIPYSGCPRGPVGRMGEPATLAEEAMFWGVIVDEDGTRFVPVVEEVLHELIEKACAVDAVEVGNCDGCYWKTIGRRQKCSCCRRNRDMKDCYRRDDDGK